jgi:DNA-binding NarL/FixJ family response regulator
MQKVKIVVVEDHLRYRKTIVALLNSDQRFEVIGETVSGDEAVSLANLLNPDVIIMDIKLVGKNGIEATRDIKLTKPHIKIIGLSLYDQPIQKLLHFGASAYLRKNSSIDEIKSAIMVASNETSLSRGQHL